MYIYVSMSVDSVVHMCVSACVCARARSATKNIGDQRSAAAS